MSERIADIEKKLLIGAYDLHIHAAPSPFNRLMDEYELLKSAADAGMSGILLKSHYESTAARAELANKYAGCATKAYAALTLNWPVGGLNPYAVYNALERKAKIIFMPTRDAENSLRNGNMPGDFFKRPGLSVLDEDGKIKKEVFEIMDAVKAHDAVLATGHLSPEESVMLCKLGRKNDVKMILTHPEFSRTKISSTVQRELADLGVYVEKCWYNIGEKEASALEMAANIKAVGAEHCFMSTDRGQKGRESPTEAMALFMKTLLEQGITVDEIQTMTRKIPEAILGVS